MAWQTNFVNMGRDFRINGLIIFSGKRGFGKCREYGNSIENVIERYCKYPHMQFKDIPPKSPEGSFPFPMGKVSEPARTERAQSPERPPITH